MADYFTAAWSGDTEMFPRLWVSGFPVAFRNITSRRLMPVCNGEFRSTGSHYNDALVLSGALWDWRKRLIEDHSVSSAQIDKAVLAAMDAVCDLSAPDRDFLAFRAALEQTAPGLSWSDDLVWAFDRHNIKDPPDEHCPDIPLLSLLSSTVEPTGRRTELAWTGVPNATAYRVYVRRWTANSIGLGLGEVVADSLTDTTYTHIEADTSATLAFVVAVLDSAGEEGAASEETPMVTDVPRRPDLAPSVVLRAFPNPAWREVRLTFEGLDFEPVRVEIFDLNGRRIRHGNWVRGTAAHWTWDLRADDGRRLGAGLYFVRARAGVRTAQVRVVVLP
jgi:hypothetical protein